MAVSIAVPVGDFRPGMTTEFILEFEGLKGSDAKTADSVLELIDRIKLNPYDHRL